MRAGLARAPEFRSPGGPRAATSSSKNSVPGSLSALASVVVGFAQTWGAPKIRQLCDARVGVLLARPARRHAITTSWRCLTCGSGAPGLLSYEAARGQRAPPTWIVSDACPSRAVIGRAVRGETLTAFWAVTGEIDRASTRTSSHQLEDDRGVPRQAANLGGGRRQPSRPLTRTSEVGRHNVVNMLTRGYASGCYEKAVDARRRFYDASSFNQNASVNMRSGSKLGYTRT